MRYRPPLIALVVALLLASCDASGDTPDQSDEQQPVWAFGAPRFSSPEEVYKWEIAGQGTALFSDISVIPDDERLRASFTCARYDAMCTPTQICEATSAG